MKLMVEPQGAMVLLEMDNDILKVLAGWHHGGLDKNDKQQQMGHNEIICQSCGMPIDKDPNKGGTNADKSKSEAYCSFCYVDGRFTDEGISVGEKIEKNIRIAISMNIPENKAREMAETIIPTLERWKE